MQAPLKTRIAAAMFVLAKMNGIMALPAMFVAPYVGAFLVFSAAAFVTTSIVLCLQVIAADSKEKFENERNLRTSAAADQAA